VIVSTATLVLFFMVRGSNAPEDKEDEKKTRRRSFFGLGEKEKEVVQEPNTGVSMASFYLDVSTATLVLFFMVRGSR
jgi:hypothetical protein